MLTQCEKDKNTPFKKIVFDILFVYDALPLGIMLHDFIRKFAISGTWFKVFLDF